MANHSSSSTQTPQVWLDDTNQDQSSVPLQQSSVPLQQSIVVVYSPAPVLQIGTDYNCFQYFWTNMTVNGATVYMGTRGSNPKRNGPDYRMFLYRDLDGHWIATEAHKDDPQPVKNGWRTWRTSSPMESIAQPGWHNWDQLDWQGSWTNFGKFETKMLSNQH